MSSKKKAPAKKPVKTVQQQLEWMAGQLAGCLVIVNRQDKKLESLEGVIDTLNEQVDRYDARFMASENRVERLNQRWLDHTKEVNERIMAAAGRRPVTPIPEKFTWEQLNTVLGRMVGASRALGGDDNAHLNVQLGQLKKYLHESLFTEEVPHE